MDSLNRAGEADALLNKRLMPAKARKPLYWNPTAWHNKKIAGGWLYNRSHLIGYQLTSYIKSSSRHYIRYRVKPIFRGRELLLGDLVQEGNIGLMLALETLGMREPGSSPLEYLRQEICQTMAQALEADRAEKEAGSLIAERLNHLRDEIKKLTDELERKVSVEELALYMDMPVEEVEDLLKLAGETSYEETEKET